MDTEVSSAKDKYAPVFGGDKRDLVELIEVNSDDERGTDEGASKGADEGARIFSRIFSKAHHTLNDKRNRLKHTTILKLLQGQTADTFISQLKL